jgi:hypothetical protein
LELELELLLLPFPLVVGADYEVFWELAFDDMVGLAM